MINKLGELGSKAVDTDYGGFSVEVDSGGGREWLWREERIQELLSAEDADVLFISGTSRIGYLALSAIRRLGAASYGKR